MKFLKNIMVQRVGDTLVVLLGKFYFIRRQKCSQFSEPYVKSSFTGDLVLHEKE